MFKEIFKAELNKYGLNWCKGCNNGRNHKRGFVANADKKTVHLDSEIAQRKSLHRGLHEIGHCVNNESGQRSFEREAGAEAFATRTMRELGIRVPREVVQRGGEAMSKFMEQVVKANKEAKSMTPAQRLTFELWNVLDDSRWVQLSDDVIESCFKEALAKALKG